MAGINNKTARQYNLKCISKDGARVTVRMAPGFNVIPDEVWRHFVPKVGASDPYVQGLKDGGQLEYGPRMDDMELEQEPDTAAKVKVVPAPKKSAKDKASS